MYICIYVCIYMCICVYVYMYIYVYIYWVAKKKYSSLIQYNLKIKRAITLKQEAFSSVMSNLNCGICHAYFNTVLADIFGCENK